MLKSRLVLSISALLLIPAGILSAGDDSRWLVPRNLVADTNLKIVWQHNLPLANEEVLDRLVVFGNRLCALSSRNYLSCLDRNDGTVIFSSFIAPAGLPVAGLQFYEGRLVTIVGNKLLEISPEFGTEQTSTPLTCGITCPVARNSSFYYFAGSDKRVHAFRADNKVQAFEVAAENDSLITSVLADQDSVIFATEAGNVVCITADKPRKLWQFNAPAAVAGAVVRDANSVYFAGRDANIYRLNLSAGDLVWKYQTQAILDASPQLGAKTIYQRVPDFGLIAVGKESGKFLWQLPNGIGLLAESGDRAFVATETGVLVAMDGTKAKQLYSVDFGRPVKFATNPADSKIYIADDAGRLACLQPAQ